MAGTVKARWVGGYDAVLPDGTQLVSGETVVELGKDEAGDSDNWHVVGSGSRSKSKGSKSKRKAKTPTPPPPDDEVEPLPTPGGDE